MVMARVKTTNTKKELPSEKELKCPCGAKYTAKVSSPFPGCLPSMNVPDGWELRHFGWYGDIPVYASFCPKCNAKAIKEIHGE